MIEMDTTRESNAMQSLLTIDDLERLLKLHRRTIARLCAAGRFPRPVKIGSSNRWKREDVERVLNESA